MLIGMDGGASKINVREIAINENSLFDIGDHNVEYWYKDIDGYDKNFTPVDINIQMEQFTNGYYLINESEEKQGKIYIYACVDALLSMANYLEKKELLIGLCMPGIKTDDDRGIAVMVNGPRIPSFCDEFEKMAEKRGIKLIWKPMKIGNDAYFCGLGEQYGKRGSFRSFRNAYYCGGGTGIADSLKINGQVVDLKEVGDWFVKTWEFISEDNIPIEDYISAKGIIKRYSGKIGKNLEDLEEEGIYISEIGELAVKRDMAAQEVINEFCYYLAKLVYERIVTLNVGYKEIFHIRNIYRKQPLENHEYVGTKLDAVVFGQRIGEFLKKFYKDELVWYNFTSNLKSFINESLFMENNTKDYYLTKIDNDEFFVFSELREAPSIGAGVYAYFKYGGYKI